jgi:colanic acid biosynthesis glycosyl transferase WcaI
MRITLVNQFYVPDLAPTAHLAASLAEHRAALGDDVRVITSLGGYVPNSEESRSKQVNGVRVHRVWTPQFGKKRNILRAIDYAMFYLSALVRIVTLPRQDVIITMTTPPYIGLIASMHKLLHWRTKIILWNMDCYPDVLEPVGMVRRGGFVSRVLRWLARVQFRSVDYLVTLDDAMTDLLVSQYAPRGKRLPTKVIPNWERLELFPAETPAVPRWEAADSLGIRDDEFNILYLGNTGYGHEFDTVLDAAERLRDQPVRFVFVGGGRRWNDIAEAAKQRQLDNLVMHTYVPKEQTPAVMALADSALITLADWSLAIMSPSKLHACLGMGLPVVYVGPEKSNVDMAIEAYDCGVSLRHGETDALVAFVERAAADPNYLADLKRRARKAFDESYCDARTLPQFDAILDELVPSSRK